MPNGTELIKIRVFVINGTAKMKPIRVRTVRAFNNAKEVEQYRTELTNRMKAKFKDAESVEVYLHTKEVFTTKDKKQIKEIAKQKKNANPRTKMPR